MPLPKKSRAVLRAFTITEMMRFDARELGRRAGTKRGSAPLVPADPEPDEPTRKYVASVLKRWRKPEKPIEIIG
jgi:hypothetical protein